MNSKNLTTFRLGIVCAVVLLASSAHLRAAAPEIVNVTPSRGPTTGGTLVFISGSGFTGATQVLFGQTAAPSFVVNNDTSIQVQTPPGAVGVVNVSVVTPEGTSTLDEAFGYGPIPIAVGDTYNTTFNTSLAVNSPGVLANDDPNQGGGVVVEVGAAVNNGTLTLNPDGGFTYTPATGFVGTDRFTYRSRNATGFSNYARVTLNVTGPTGPLPPTAFRVSQVRGNRITLRWTMPTVGPAATGFTIEGGVAPGQVASTILVGAVPEFTFEAPTGTYYLRVRTRSGTAQSDPSNEVVAFINVPAVPSAPEHLVGLVNDSGLALAWRNSFAGGEPTGIVLDVTGSLTTSLVLGPTDTFSYAGVPPGTYTFSVRAINAAGSSAPSAPLTLTFPGACSGVPVAPAEFAAYKVGNTLHVAWEPATSGAAPTGYVVNVSGSLVGVFPTTARALSGSVGPGTYTFNVVATNACGASAATPAQTVTVP